MSGSRVQWTDEQGAALHDADLKFKAWLDDIGLKKGMRQNKPLPGVSESVTAHRLGIAAELMEMKGKDDQLIFPQTEDYTKVSLDYVQFVLYLRFPLVRARSLQELHFK
jgi:hypothetical protein